MSSSDEESFNSNAFYLSENLQPLPNTTFAAMTAKEQTNNATKSTNQDTRSTNAHEIGVLGKNSVKEVSDPKSKQSVFLIPSKIRKRFIKLTHEKAIFLNKHEYFNFLINIYVNDAHGSHHSWTTNMFLTHLTRRRIE